MIEQIFKLTQGNEKTVEKVIIDENIIIKKSNYIFTHLQIQILFLFFQSYHTPHTNSMKSFDFILTVYISSHF